MIAAVLAFVTFAQLFGMRGYTLAADDGMLLALPTGRYALSLGYGCDGMNVSQNVEVYVGSHGVATINPPDVDLLCDVYIGEPVSDTPCAVNADGVCDVALESE